MAKYRCKWVAYSDSTRTIKVGELDGIIGVADTWDGVYTPIEEQIDVTRNYGFFTNHVGTPYEQNCIGKKYLQLPADPQSQINANYGLFMPLSWLDTWNFASNYWDVELASGVKVIINHSSVIPTTGGWGNTADIMVVHPERGTIYNETVTDMRGLLLLPFGATPQIHGGSPNIYGCNALLRDYNGDYGYGQIQWGYDIYSNLHEYAAIYKASDSVNAFLKLVFQGAESTDPYYEYEVVPGGDDPDPPEIESDPDFPPEPSFSATDSGMLTLFNPSLSEIQALASYMWSTNFDISQLIKIFADPIDAILGLSIVPINVTQGARATFYVGNIPTNVTMYKCAKQFETFDCGTINVGKKYGSYLDFAPNTDAQIYLPFIGVVRLDINDIMGKTLHLKYRFDLMSGACCAMLACGGKVLYTFVGQAAISVPITGHDWTNMMNGAISIAATLGGMVATGGATVPTGIPSIASATINAFKQNIQKSGSLGGPGGILGPLNPYLILTRPRAAWPENLKHYEGYPSFISRKLEDVDGFTIAYKLHLEGIPATDEELDEIDRLLKEGVVL